MSEFNSATGDAQDAHTVKPARACTERSDKNASVGLDDAPDMAAAAMRLVEKKARILPLHTSSNGQCSCGKASCESPGKHPVTRRGVHDASNDFEQVTSWWKNDPLANIGVKTGAEMVVLDVDPRNGGHETLATLIAVHGPLPHTIKAKTGGGGEHFWFAVPDGKTVKSPGPGIDIKGRGGYVVAPPSLHPSGARYEWEVAPWEADPAPIPGWLITPTPADAAGSESTPDVVDRATLMRRLPPELIERIDRPDNGQDRSTHAHGVFQALLEIKPALSNIEIRTIADGALFAAKYADRNDLDAEIRRQRVKQKDVERKVDRAIAGSLMSVCAANIEPQRVEWIWSGRLARGKHTCIAGEPATGKSQTLAWIAAAVTTGGAWPCNEGSAPCGNVIILAAEDGAADTLVPRLMAAGADLRRVHIVTAASAQAGSRHISLKTDLAALEAKVAEVGDVVLIAIDPITAYMGDTESRKNTAVRAVLDPLNEMADRTGVCILSVTHFRKQGSGETGGKAAHRFIDSIAFVAGPRVCLAVVDDGQNSGRRLLLPVKGNLSAEPAGLAFSFEKCEVAAGIEATRVKWETEPVAVTADEALAAAARQGNMSDTRRAILEVLSESDEGMKPSDIAAATALKADVVRQRLHQMAKAEVVRKVGNLYWHPDRGPG